MTVRRFCLLSGCAGLLALTVACSSTPPDTREADAKAVRDRDVAWSNDMASRDIDKIVRYYAPNAALLVPNVPAIVGKDAIRSALKPLVDDPNFSLTFQPTTVEASKGGDFVYTQGTYSQTNTDPKNSKKTVSDKGKYVEVWRKQADGNWLAVEDMINSDLPFTPPVVEKAKPARAKAKARKKGR